MYREEVGRVWKWVILICVGSKPFLTCLWEFFLHINGFRLFLLLLQLDHLSTRCSPLFLEIERKHGGNGRSDSKGSWWWCKGDVEVPFKSWLFFFLSVSVQTQVQIQASGSNGLRKRFNPHREHLKVIGSQVDEKTFRFPSGGSVNNIRVTLVYAVWSVFLQSTY